MYLYWNIIKFNFFRFFAYPFEIIAGIAKRSLTIVFLVLFWSIIGQHSDNPIAIYDLISYFLIASAINSFVMAEYTVFGGWIGDIVKQGDLTNYLIKPISLVPYLYSTYVGKIGLRLSFSVFTLILGLLLSPPKSFISVVLFILFLFLAMLISFSFNIIVGVLAFYLTDVKGIRSSVSHFTNLLSGATAPLALFPVDLRNFVLLTPFPYMIYGPINALKTTTIDENVIREISISTGWAIVLLILAVFLWKRGIKRYEAIGI